MSSLSKLAVGCLASLALAPQQLPSLPLKPGDNGYCRHTFTDLKGVAFPGVVRARAEPDSTVFQVFEESSTYKAPTDEIAFQYATKRRATITVNGNAIDDGDVVTLDSTMYFVSAEKPLPPEAVKFANEVFACVGAKKT